MPTRYLGVFCPKKHFVILREYPIEHPNAPYSGHLSLPDPATFRCDECRDVCLYQQSDLAYSNAPDGTDAAFPFR